MRTLATAQELCPGRNNSIIRCCWAATMALHLTQGVSVVKVPLVHGKCGKRGEPVGYLALAQKEARTSIPIVLGTILHSQRLASQLLPKAPIWRLIQEQNDKPCEGICNVKCITSLWVQKRKYTLNHVLLMATSCRESFICFKMFHS